MDGNPADEADIPDDGDTRTAAWYRTRAMLALGIGAVLVPVVLLFFGPEALYASVGNATLVVPLNGPLTWAGFLGILLGLAWMIRIFRGPRDEPPRWRYRDR